MTDPTQDYFAKLKALRSQQQPNSTYDDISKRASELSMLMPKTQTRGLYGLASDLSRGLVQQAASGRPSSIGYGLAAGFNLYSEAEKDPTIKLKPEYKLALKYVTEPRRTPVQTESGTQIIESPGLDVSDIFGPAPDEAPPEGATFTGRYNAADGKKIFQRPGPTGAMEYFTKD